MIDGRRFVQLAVCAALIASPACAGPPYFTDDPEPPDEHFEIFFFNQGTKTAPETDGATGVDFNYRAGPNLQLTAVVADAYIRPTGEPHVSGLGNIELGAKYRFLHQEDIGWDVAIFPTVILPSASRQIGEQHASFYLPVWMQKDWGEWSTFGGGGCTINRGGDSRDFCQMGWALSRKVLPNLQLGGEIYHQTPNVRGGHAITGANLAFQFDVTEHVHLVGSGGPGLQNADQTNQYSWYAALLLTF